MMRSRTIAAAALAICVHAAAATAQDRLPPIPSGTLTDAQKKAVDDFKTARAADLTGPFIPLLRSPELMTRTRALGDYVRFRSVLPPRLSEFLILLTARSWTQTYEWNVHLPTARQAGVSADTIAAIAQDRQPAAMTDDEAALYAFATELRRDQGVSDATYARILARFGEQGVVDAVGIVGYYTMLAMVLNTARTPAPAGGTALPPLRR